MIRTTLLLFGALMALAPLSAELTVSDPDMRRTLEEARVLLGDARFRDETKPAAPRTATRWWPIKAPVAATKPAE